VTQDAHRFPELGRRYREQVVEQRNAIFARYLERTADAEKWKVRDARAAGNAFVGLLRAKVFDDALHGLRTFGQQEILAQARWAAGNMLILLGAGKL
jgi:hypothetical protein